MKMDKEKIVLYGAGFEAEKFYYKYQEQYQIVFCIDRNANRMFHDVPVYTVEEAEERLREFFIVVAVFENNVYAEIKQTLESKGLVEYLNFQSMKQIGKKMCILYGNCHMTILEKYLKGNPYFDREYYVVTLRVYQLDHAYWKKSLKKCALLIAMDILQKNSLDVPGYEEIIQMVPSGCKYIIIPNLRGYNLFFPQAVKMEGDEEFENIVKKHIGENAFLKETYEKNSKIIRQKFLYLIWFRDCYIEEQYQKGKTVEEIVWNIQHNDIWTEQEIQDHFHHQMQRIQEREKKCDIKISDYILENYQKKKLFYEFNHTSNDIIFEKSKRILNLLGIKVVEEIDIGCSNAATELFIYGCVKRALGIKFHEDFIRIGCSGMTVLSSGQSLSLTEYVQDYINWNLR